MAVLEFTKARRKSVPLLVSMSGTSSSGKTYSSLLLAAGLAGPNGRVGMLDTENNRGLAYVDSPGIMAALPQGYEHARIDAPFSPAAYIDGIESAEKAGIQVLVIDSGSHEYEGIGGVCEIAENNKLKGMPNWAMAKLAHKRFVNRMLASPMHIILCLRAREKVKITADNKFVPLGLQPITERNLPFEMMLSLKLREEDHFATAIKCPEAFKALFDTPHLITKADGQKIREWNNGGAAMDPAENIQKRARLASSEGTERYADFFKNELSAAERKLIEKFHDANKAFAKQADEEAARAQTDPGMQPEAYPDKAEGVIAGLHALIEQERARLGESAFAAVLKRWGKSTVSEITNELNAEEILADLKQVKS